MLISVNNFIDTQISMDSSTFIKFYGVSTWIHQHLQSFMANPLGFINIYEVLWRIHLDSSTFTKFCGKSYTTIHLP